MTTQAASSPTGAPRQNGVNGAKGPGQAAYPYAPSQTPVPLPNYAPQSGSPSASSAPQKQASSASPAQPGPFIPPGQHRSPSVQSGMLSRGPSQPPQMQNASAAQTQTPQQAQQPLQSQGHMSPPAQRQPQTVDSLKIYQDLITLVDRAPATAVRQVVRDKWEKSLLGSQYHIAFLLNATMHQASPDTVAKAVKEFGASLAQNAKHEVIDHLGMTDVDELTDAILARASPQFLDKALAKRLETIPARQLVNALARAERLGYDVQDIVRDHDEQVIPSMHSVPTPSTMPPADQAMRIQHYEPRPVPSQQPPQQPPQPPPQPPTYHQTLPPLPSRATIKDLPLGPPGLVWCNCGWPCASKAALDHHHKKHACNKVQQTDVAGRDICLFCGCRFGSDGGLLYHEKSNVCGDHTRDVSEKMKALIDYLRIYGRKFRHRPAYPIPGTPAVQTQPPSTQHHATTATPTPSQPSSTPGRDPYAHLTPKQLREFNEIMQNAEEKYGGLMREAMLLDEPERSKRLASLKNSYNTKQSTTRKRFGIRLRERRTRVEIEADEARLLNSPSRNGTPTNGTPVPGDESRPKKRPRTDDAPVPTSSGMTGTQEVIQKRVPRAEMSGGLSGSQATAELTDPTAYLNPPQPRYTPQKPSAASSQPKTSWSPSHARASLRGTQDDPMAIDDDDSDTDSDSDDDDDGDIPATL